MKKQVFYLLGIALLACGATAAQAQNSVYKMNVPYVTPKTAIKIKVQVQKEEIKKGPYAKFAQQYLGVNAPLNDKTVYSLVNADMNAYNEADPSNIYVLSNPMAAPVELIAKNIEVNDASNKPGNGQVSAQPNTMPFQDMGIDPIVYNGSTGGYAIDRSSAKEKSLDEMAASAANAIFTLRKRRFDLVTGESGENVFGAGLKAAIDEMKRLEDEYLALFIGQKQVTVKTYEFDVVPEQGKDNYIPCRFSTGNGVVDASDVSGEPIVLTVTPEGKVQSQPVTKSAAKGSVIYYRIADMASCKLFLTTELLAAKRVPVYQFGATVEVVSATR